MTGKDVTKAPSDASLAECSGRTDVHLTGHLKILQETSTILVISFAYLAKKTLVFLYTCKQFNRVF